MKFKTYEFNSKKSVFRRDIIKELVETYGFTSVLAHHIVNSRVIAEGIMKDESWAQQQGAKYWADMIAEGCGHNVKET